MWHRSAAPTVPAIPILPQLSLQCPANASLWLEGCGRDSWGSGTCVACVMRRNGLYLWGRRRQILTGCTSHRPGWAARLGYRTAHRSRPQLSTTPVDHNCASPLSATNRALCPGCALCPGIKLSAVARPRPPLQPRGDHPPQSRLAETRKEIAILRACRDLNILQFVVSSPLYCACMESSLQNKLTWPAGFNPRPNSRRVPTCRPIAPCWCLSSWR